MPFLTTGGQKIYFEDTGGKGPPLLMSHGLLWSCRMYDAQVAQLRSRYRCVIYDHRGQGQSDVPDMSVIDMETLYRDTLSLMDQLELGPCHFVGLSMGGFIGMRLAARRPELVRSLVLMETRAQAESRTKARRYRLLTWLSRIIGVRPLADKGMALMFGKTFLNDPEREGERELWRERIARNRGDIWRAINGVIYRRGVESELGNIRAPTLVLVGEEDATTDFEDARFVAQGIRGAKLITLPRCGHTSTVENPGAVNQILSDFFDAQGANPALSDFGPDFRKALKGITLSGGTP